MAYYIFKYYTTNLKHESNLKCVNFDNEVCNYSKCVL